MTGFLVLLIFEIVCFVLILCLMEPSEKMEPEIPDVELLKRLYMGGDIDLETFEIEIEHALETEYMKGTFLEPALLPPAQSQKVLSYPERRAARTQKMEGE